MRTLPYIYTALWINHPAFTTEVYAYIRTQTIAPDSCGEFLWPRIRSVIVVNACCEEGGHIQAMYGGKETFET